jgi:hypothetical protein
MASTIPPPHVPFASGSSYLLNALVPVPLPFFFLFLGLLLVRQSFPFVFGALYAPVWVFRLSAFHSPLPEAGPLCAPTTLSFSHCHLPQRCYSKIAPEPSPVDHSTFYFMFSLVSLLFFSFVLFFVLIFLCILFFWVSLYLL